MSNIVKIDRLRVHNWEVWQSYRKGRGQPGWIKLWRRLMDKEEWVLLEDAERGQLVAIWLLAANHSGTIPADPYMVQKLCHMTSEPNLQTFINMGFLEDGDQVADTCQPVDSQVVANVAAQNRREEKRKEKNESGAHAPFAFVGRVISLSQIDYDHWLQIFPNVNLRPFLESRDIWLSELPEDDNRRRKWMVGTAADLRNKNDGLNAKPALVVSKATDVGFRKIFEPEPPKPPLSDEELVRRAEQVKKYLRAKPMPTGRH